MDDALLTVAEVAARAEVNQPDRAELALSAL